MESIREIMLRDEESTAILFAYLFNYFPPDLVIRMFCKRTNLPPRLVLLYFAND